MKPFWKFVLAGVGIGTFYLLGKKAMDFKTKAEWAKYIYDSINSIIPELAGNTRAKLIIIAHAAYESGWGGLGTSSPSHLKKTNNIFNITCGDSWKGARMQQANADTAYAPDGTYLGKIAQCWRIYPSQQAAIADYWKLLDNQNYRVQGVKNYLRAGDVVGFVRALSAGKYFTLPVDDFYKNGVLQKGYLASMSSIINSVASFV